MPLGLINSETLQTYWSQNTRRRIFKAYPNGAAPLTGLLSMTENDDTPQPEFTWTEDRWQAIRTTTLAGSTGNGVFYQFNTLNVFVDAGTMTAGVQYRVAVADATLFQTDDVIKIFSVVTNAAAPLNIVDLMIRVDTVSGLVGGAYYVDFTAVNTVVGVRSGIAGNVGLQTVLVGSAYAEGSRSRTGRIRFPFDLTNYTQIFKTPYEMTRTALKEPLRYDKTGDYARISQSNGIDHLSQLEFSLFFGERQKTTAVDPDTGQVVSRRFTGGLRWFLDQWEAGTAYGQTACNTQTDWETFTNKRVIKLGGGTLTKKQFNLLNSRVFERTNNSTWDKLCFCGPGYYASVTDFFERQILSWKAADQGFKGWDFTLNQHNGNAGTVYYKVHPLFNDPFMRNSAFYVDLGYIGYRPLTDSDTDIQPMIQAPDADKRKDQWLTECGFELRFPEAHMYVENLGGITA